MASKQNSNGGFFSYPFMIVPFLTEFSQYFSNSIWLEIKISE